MMHAVVLAILATYPRWWKERYGAETAGLTEDLLAEGGRVRVVLDLVAGSFLAWVHYRRPDRRPSQLAGAALWGPVPDGGHRDLFGNAGLSPRSIDSLDAGEIVLGVFDGWTGSPVLSRLPGALCNGLALSIWILFIQSPDRSRQAASSVIISASWAAAVVAALAVRRRTSSRGASFAVTDRGIVVLRTALLTRSTVEVIERIDPAPPVMLRAATFRVKMDFGGKAYWVRTRSFPLLRWMSGPAGALTT